MITKFAICFISVGYNLFVFLKLWMNPFNWIPIQFFEDWSGSDFENLNNF
jgi:hypothetical protein